MRHAIRDVSREKRNMWNVKREMGNAKNDPRHDTCNEQRQVCHETCKIRHAIWHMWNAKRNISNVTDSCKRWNVKWETIFICNLGWIFDGWNIVIKEWGYCKNLRQQPQGARGLTGAAPKVQETAGRSPLGCRGSVGQLPRVYSGGPRGSAPQGSLNYAVIPMFGTNARVRIFKTSVCLLS